MDMSSDTTREPGLFGQIVVVIGGGAGTGLEIAPRARTDGVKLIHAWSHYPGESIPVHYAWIIPRAKSHSNDSRTASSDPKRG
jgi:hypothetical protein